MDETGWLIETSFGALPAYWCCHQGRPMFTTDHQMACRFSRNEDAEAVMAWIAPTAKAVDHAWVNP